MTVGELIEKLEKYPKDMNVFSLGVDDGGYDAVLTSNLLVIPGKEHPWVPSNYFQETTYYQQLCSSLYVGGIDN